MHRYLDVLGKRVSPWGHSISRVCVRLLIDDGHARSLPSDTDLSRTGDSSDEAAGAEEANRLGTLFFLPDQLVERGVVFLAHESFDNIGIDVCDNDIADLGVDLVEDA